MDPLFRLVAMAVSATLRLRPWCARTGALVCLAIVFFAPEKPFAAEPPTDPVYLTELVEQAHGQKLSAHKQWLRLVHYRPRALFGYKSEVDGDDFFNARNGKTDPAAELAATLKAFFDAPPEEAGVQHPQCRFVARYAWLNEVLGFDPARLPQQPCQRFEQWQEALNPAHLTLVFPSAYLNSPPSMFGHTLIRLDNGDKPSLLDYALNYAAEVPDGDDSFYALKGLFGFFPGRFSLLPFYAKVQAYGEIENRDLWEYRLNFSKKQIDLVLMHAWELGSTFFRYYFIKENCSYHILSLLEVADPELNLTSGFVGWVLPTDTLRVVAKQPGLVADVEFRPSRSSIIRHRQQLMPKQEVKEAVRIATGRQTPDDLTAGPAYRARVLDLAYDYLLYLEADRKKKGGDGIKERKHRVLTARAELDTPATDMQVPTPAVRPDKGHRTERTSIGGGERDGAAFYQLGYRAAYHDLLDTDPGYQPNSQLEVFAVEVRHYTDDDRVELSRLKFLDILSISPWDGFFKSRSWKISAAWQSRQTGDCTGCGAFNFNFGPGIALSSSLINREVYYLFADIDANWGTGFDRNHALGGGGQVGLVATLTGFLKLHAFARYTGYGWGEQYEARAFSVQSRIALGRNLAVRFSVSETDAPFADGVESRVELHGYW